MPDVPFASSDPLTVGIEEEFLLVDAVDGVAAAPKVEELLGGELRTHASPGGWFKPELLQCTIEHATAPNARMLQLDVDLRALRDELVDRADAAGVHLVGIGMHPDLRVDDSLVTPTRAHETIAALHRRVGTLADQATHGVHVHIGMPDLDAALRVTDALAACAPMLYALSVNSPVANGVRAPWRSARAEVLRRMLWAGTTPHFTDVDEYRAIHAQHQLENSGDQRFLWEVAPVTALGTVEVRIVNSMPDADVVLGLAAFMQAIAAYVLDGGELPRANESLERHNRWSATEFGPRARFLVLGRDEPVDVAHLIYELLDKVEPAAQALGSAAWLDVIERQVTDSVIDRSVAAFEAGGVPALVEQCRVVRRPVPDPADA